MNIYFLENKYNMQGLRDEDFEWEEDIDERPHPQGGARTGSSSSRSRPDDGTPSPPNSAPSSSLRAGRSRFEHESPLMLEPASLDGASSLEPEQARSGLRRGVSTSTLSQEGDRLSRHSTTPGDRLSRRSTMPGRSPSGLSNIEQVRPGVFVTSVAARQEWEERERQRQMKESGEKKTTPSMSDEEEFEEFYTKIKQRMRDVDISDLGRAGLVDAGGNLLKGAGVGALGAAAGMFILATVGVPGLVAAKGTAAGAAAKAGASGAAYGLFSKGNPLRDPDLKINLLLILCFYLLKDNMMNAVNSVDGELTKKTMLETKIRDIYKFLYDAYKNEKVKGDEFHVNFVENISKELFKMINDYTRARPHQRGWGKKKTKMKQKKKTKKKQKKKTKKKQKKS